MCDAAAKERVEERRRSGMGDTESVDGPKEKEGEVARTKGEDGKKRTMERGGVERTSSYNGRIHTLEMALVVG